MAECIVKQVVVPIFTGMNHIVFCCMIVRDNCTLSQLLRIKALECTGKCRVCLKAWRLKNNISELANLF